MRWFQTTYIQCRKLIRSLALRCRGIASSRIASANQPYRHGACGRRFQTTIEFFGGPGPE
jgi:hypothetical protein